LKNDCGLTFIVAETDVSVAGVPTDCHGLFVHTATRGCREIPLSIGKAPRRGHRRPLRPAGPGEIFVDGLANPGGTDN
jgi:hypothetical protein